MWTSDFLYILVFTYLQKNCVEHGIKHDIDSAYEI